jgi:hypothetical protein
MGIDGVSKLAMVAALAVTLGGCVLAVRSDSSWEHGRQAMEGLETVKSGVTSRAWIFEHLGRPDSAYVNEAGNEVLRYVARHEEEVEVSLLFLFSFDASDDNVYTIHVEIEDDIVKGYWVESI